MNKMLMYKVGEKFPENINMDGEIGIRFDGAEFTLYLSYVDPTSKEIQNIKKGTFSAGLTRIDDAIFFLFRFGTSPWMDVPFSPYLTGSAQISDISKDQGYPMAICLVDERTRILRVYRIAVLSTEFSQAFNKMFTDIKSKPFDQSHYDATKRGVYAAYNTSQLLELASVRI